MTEDVADRDRHRLAELVAAGVRLDEARWVTHSFSFVFNLDGAIAAYHELGLFPFSIISEQGDDDDYMDIATFRRHALSLAEIGRARAWMEQVAERHGGTYDGWWPTNPPPRSDRHPFADFRRD